MESLRQRWSVCASPVARLDTVLLGQQGFQRFAITRSKPDNIATAIEGDLILGDLDVVDTNDQTLVSSGKVERNFLLLQNLVAAFGKDSVNRRILRNGDVVVAGVVTDKERNKEHQHGGNSAKHNGDTKLTVGHLPSLPEVGWDASTEGCSRTTLAS